MKSELEKAKNHAFLLLKFRLRSKREIEERLKIKKFSNETIKSALDYLVSLGFIDDLKFANAWINNRLNFRPRSKSFLKYELVKKGIAKEIIDNALLTIDDEKEYSIAQGIAEKKLSKLKDQPPDKIRKKLFSCLQQRGFSINLSLRITKELIGNDE